MLKLIQNAHVFAPENLGKKDLLIEGEQICHVADKIEIQGNIPIEKIDGEGKYLFPGFIDNHVHITGGGGEGGFRTRTPEILLSDIIKGGITTIIGVLGTDGCGRSMQNLMAKAKALEEEGVSTFVLTGSYQIPVKTLSESISSDILFHDRIIGVGELAISDHRSSCPTFEELSKIAAETRVAGMLAGKIGVVNIHMGDGKDALDLVEEIIDNTEIPIKHFVPTHINRSEYVFERGLQYLKRGGNIDFTTSTVPIFIEEGEVLTSKGIKRILEENLDLSKVTLSSDGQGSLPTFDETGKLVGIEVGRVTSLYQAVIECIKEEKIPIESAICLITSNPAQIYGLTKKGCLKEGYDADMVLVDQNSLEIQTVIAKGQILMQDTALLVKGTFEK